MKIGIPRELRNQETRVAATPETVKKLMAGGHNAVLVQAGDRLPSVTDLEKHFGVAKSTGGQLADRTIYTGFVREHRCADPAGLAAMWKQVDEDLRRIRHRAESAQPRRAGVGRDAQRRDSDRAPEPA